MPSTSSKLPRVTQLLACANGSSQPWFASLDNGSEWLIKFSAAGPGAGALLAEYLANSLGRLWGLPIPEAQVVWLDSTIERAGTDEFWDVLARSVGPNLAIQKIADAENVVPDGGLPPATLASLAAFDTLLQNWDRTALSRNLLRDPKGKLWWIDHGSCRFLHGLDRSDLPALPSNHFSAGTALELPDLPSLPGPSLLEVETMVAGAPLPWLGAIGVERSSLATALHAYLLRATG